MTTPWRGGAAGSAGPVWPGVSRRAPPRSPGIGFRLFNRRSESEPIGTDTAVRHLGTDPDRRTTPSWPPARHCAVPRGHETSRTERPQARSCARDPANPPELPPIEQDDAHAAQPLSLQLLLPAVQRTPKAEIDRSLGDAIPGRCTAEITLVDHGIAERPSCRGRPQRRVVELRERRHRGAPSVQQRGARFALVALEVSGRPSLRCVTVETPTDPVLAQPDEVCEDVLDSPSGTGRNHLPGSAAASTGSRRRRTASYASI